MFVNPIKSLDKTRFGVNFFPDDIKCKLNKEKDKLKKNNNKNMEKLS